MATITDPVVRAHKREIIEKAVLRFCGDSGDGMQITGSQFTNTVALYGNDLATFPTIPPKFALPRGRFPASAASKSSFPRAMYSPRVTPWTCWWR
jgi:2-oxoglutarate ferredoxin oxidoreductase subunit alpha